MKSWLFLGVAIIAEVVATSALKSTDGFTRLWPSLLAIAGYSCAFFFLALALRIIPVGIAYAIWAGMGIILIAIAGVFLYGQKLDMPALIGMALIMGGIIIMNLFSKSVPH